MPKFFRRANRPDFEEETLWEGPPLRDSEDEQVRVRVVRTKHGTHIDIRQYMNMPDWKGFTRRGLRLNWEAAQFLKEQWPAALKEYERHLAVQVAKQAVTEASGRAKVKPRQIG